MQNENAKKMPRGGKGKPFQKGWAGGPGRNPLPEEVKEFRKTFGPKVEADFLRLLHLNQSELHAIHTSGDTPAHTLIFARFIQQAINIGDIHRVSFIYERAVGTLPKPSINLNTQINVGETTPELKMDKKERDTILMHMLKLRKEPGDKLCRLTENSLELSQESSPLSLPPPSGTES